MAWILTKFDRLLGTVFAAVVGISASQAQAFIAAYLQRLGGHLDEARRMVETLRAGGFADVDAASQERLARSLGHRLADLTNDYDAIASADVFSRPFALIAHMDRSIAEATLTGFTPALPLDSASLAYALLGMVLGWLVYETVTLPFRLIGRRATR